MAYDIYAVIYIFFSLSKGMTGIINIYLKLEIKSTFFFFKCKIQGLTKGISDAPSNRKPMAQFFFQEDFESIDRKIISTVEII